MKIFLIILCTIFVFAIHPQQLFADGSCFTLNNGGATTQQVCPTPTVWPTPAPFTENIPSQNANGQMVYSPSKTKTTPDTGPEDWTLPGLIAAGIVGFYIRRKTNYSSDNS